MSDGPDRPAGSQFQLGGSGTVTRIRSNSLTVTPLTGRGDVQIEAGTVSPMLHEHLAVELGSLQYAGAGANHVIGAHFILNGPDGLPWNGGTSLAWDDAGKSFHVLVDGIYSVNSVGNFTNQGVIGAVDMFLLDFGNIDNVLECEEFQQAVNPNTIGSGAIQCRPKMPGRFIPAGEELRWFSVNGTGTPTYHFNMDFVVQRLA